MEPQPQPKPKPARKIRKLDPLKPFPNEKWEAFCHAIARGETQGQSAILAGYSPLRAGAQGCQMVHRPVIQDRINNIRSRTTNSAIERVALSKCWVLQNLRDNVERALQSVEIIDSKGNRTGEYRYDGSVVNRGLELIGKELGMFVDRKILGIQDLRHASADDLYSLLSEIDSAIEARQLTEGSKSAQSEQTEEQFIPPSDDTLAS